MREQEAIDMNRKSYKTGIALLCLLVVLMVQMVQMPVCAAAGSVRGEETTQTVHVLQNRFNKNTEKKGTTDLQQDVQKTEQPSSGTGQMTQKAAVEETQTDVLEKDEEQATFLGMRSIPLLVLTGIDSLIVLAILSVLGFYIWKQFGKPGF